MKTHFYTLTILIVFALTSCFLSTEDAKKKSGENCTNFAMGLYNVDGSLTIEDTVLVLKEEDFTSGDVEMKYREKAKFMVILTMKRSSWSLRELYCYCDENGEILNEEEYDFDAEIPVGIPE